ncbi:MAG: transglutaminase-like domain-containing protein [Candidatus Nanoarchaeia archaeon]|jgi:transglutaminase-like putative cysteine protease|nr:transglutaminase-like domain-containing protein [Candidatus Nanoarchaeia archaeon]|tara:strand:- start:17392 stop:19302 length:1911 start_codon:yes stop_codon:yes gene_type:complete
MSSVSAQLEVERPLEDYNKYSSLELNVNLGSEIEVVPKKRSYDIDYIDVDLKYYPDDDDRQEIISQEIKAEGAEINKNNNIINIVWEDPRETKYTYSVNTLVKTKNDFKKVTKRIPFPIQNLDYSLYEYTSEGEFIDINEDIKKIAVELAEGEDDLYVVTFKIADWINKNIEYDLSTLTADVVQKSSWVLENRQGVCDELTNLFISMLRSVNIPARFLGGIVYTNVGSYFGNHGWAEVYFPGYGWVPFDVTFGQYGWIDPSHVKLSYVQDSGESAVDYKWKSNGVTLNSKGLSIETTVKKLGGRIAPNTILDIKPLEEEINFGSYIPLEVSIKNSNHYYTPLSVIITKSPSLLEENVKAILLKPNEEKKLFWTIEIDEDLNKKFVYTSELEAKTNFGATSSSIIKFSKGFDDVSKEEAEETIGKLEIREEKRFLSDLTLSCDTLKQDYYSDEKINIKCIVENVGNENIKDLNVCVITNCKKLDLFIAEKKELNFDVKLSSSLDLRISAETDSLIRYDELNLNVIKVPKIRFIDIEPKSIDYNELIDLNFDIFSNTIINNVSLEVEDVANSKLKNFEGRYKIITSIKGKQIKDGVLTLKLFYKDELGEDRKHEEKHKIEITNIPFYRKWMTDIFSLF